MSLRPSSVRSAIHHAAAVRDDRFVLSLGRAGRQRRVSLSPVAFYAAIAVLPAIAAIYLGATAFLFFRDDMIAALMARHAQQQYAYEDRLAALRLQLDRQTGKQMLDQDSVDGKLRELVMRQARIETRAAVLASLSDAFTLPGGNTTIEAKSVKGGKSFMAPVPLVPLATARARSVPVPALEQIATPSDSIEEANPKPQPEDPGLRPSADATAGTTSGAGRGMSSDRRAALSAPVGLTLADIAGDDVPVGMRVGTLASAIDQSEHAQATTLRRLEAPAAALASRLRSVIAATGLSAERLKLPAATTGGVGGPYVPLRIDAHASEFDAQLARTQAAVLSLETVRRILPSVPVLKPLSGALEQTSSFGYRLDPFLGRPALHSGIDFRGEYGSAVHATAGGKVITAGASGGYGNMVEIEHANGVSTRYGHLSAITVSEGQNVQAGAIVGRVGSTGRSTGNHLHYEVRIDQEAVDPSRFIKAAALLPD